MARDLVGVLLLVGLAGCAAGPGYVKAEDFGDAWPFTVDEGELICTVVDRGSIPRPAVVFVAPDGTPYALNGVAISRGMGIDIREGTAIRKPGASTHVLTKRALELCR